jgi:hypothetical protein
VYNLYLTINILQAGTLLFPIVELHIFYKKDFNGSKALRIDPNLKPRSITEQKAILRQSDFDACADHRWPTARPDDLIPEDREPDSWSECRPKQDMGKCC